MNKVRGLGVAAWLAYGNHMGGYVSSKQQVRIIDLGFSRFIGGTKEKVSLRFRSCCVRGVCEIARAIHAVKQSADHRLQIRNSRRSLEKRSILTNISAGIEPTSPSLQDIDVIPTERQIHLDTNFRRPQPHFLSIMPPPPQVSPVTGKPIPSDWIHADTAHFRDTSGRVVLLRGVNLSGSVKAPIGAFGHKLERFWEDAEEEGKLSWKNQPLNLQDGSADVHLARLRGWGFNCLRYVFTWESIEHDGPKKYDMEYIDYVVEVLRKCKEYGFRVYMDPHQDIWSRFCGGSGAPLWTLYACGMNPRNFTATHAAFIQSEYPTAAAPDPAGLPAMIWSTNYTRLACQTLFTLFFGGKDFAPLCTIDDVNIQDYLQSHYLGACEKLAERIAAAGDLLESCVIGWDSLNEPGEGLIGQADIGVVPASQANKIGPTPTAFQSMMLGMGQAIECENWKVGSLGPAKTGMIKLDPKGVKAWLEPDVEDEDGVNKRWGWKRGKGWQLGKCIWAMHGVWDPETSTLIKSQYFARNPATDKAVDFIPQHWRAHWIAFAEMVRRHHPEAIHFVQPPVFHKPPELPKEMLANRACLSPHFYDGLTLITKHWNWFNADAVGLLRGHYRAVVQALKVGEGAIRRSIHDQLGILRADTFERLGQYPTLIGEIGIPYDMDQRKAYGFVDGGKGEGDYSAQQKALDASLNATDGSNALNFTLWTYVPDNSHEWGDNWNGEDLSIWSEDDTERAMSTLDYPPSETASTRSATPVGGGGGTRDSVGRSSARSSQPILQASTYSESSTLATTVELVDKVSPKIIAEGSAIPPKLLLDGARALGAFCRPFPIATVGRPKWIEFDLKSSQFKYTVDVSSEDVTGTTEIYVPYVHYATDASFAAPLGKEGGMQLDLDVELSTGSYEVRGQSLFWKYDLPSSGSKQVNIVIKRRNGAIPQRATASSPWYTSLCPSDGGCVVM